MDETDEYNERYDREREEIARRFPLVSALELALKAAGLDAQIHWSSGTLETVEVEIYDPTEVPAADVERELAKVFALCSTA